MTEQEKYTRTRAAEAVTGSAKSAADSAKSAAVTAKGAGIKGVEAGRHALESASGKVASTASTAKVRLGSRKGLVAGAGAGAVVIGAASFVAGRWAEQRSRGPISRLLAGRI